jgi:hypothetical protein
MPQIIVTAGDAADLTEGTVLLRERINERDFESDRFAANLLERLGWAVSDATEVERDFAADSADAGGPEDSPDAPRDSRQLVNA